MPLTRAQKATRGAHSEAREEGKGQGTPASREGTGQWRQKGGVLESMQLPCSVCGQP